VEHVWRLIHRIQLTSLTLFDRIDKKFYKPVDIQRWVVVIYAEQRRFNEGTARDMVSGLVRGCRQVGENQHVHFL
jgi:Mid domain of argonaute